MFDFSNFSVSTLFLLFFISIFAINIVRNLRQWHQNNQSPVLTVEATLVAKRIQVAADHHGSRSHRIHHSSTSYFLTFQVLSGDRMEFHVNGEDYGLLVEGDRGALTFQGTRYLRFDRYKENSHA